MPINNFKKKLILGTAQMGKPYGFNNPKKKRLSETSVINLLKYVRSRHINHIDTAESYGVKNKYFKKKNWIIDTKIQIEKNNQNLTSVLKKLNFFLISPNVRIDTIYIHNPELLLSPYGKKLFIVLEEIKKMKLIKNIGLSVYDTKTTLKLINFFNIDVVQIPYNVFDRRFEKIIKNLRKKKIKIYARSIFLQGSLLSKRKTKLTLKPEFRKFDEFSKKKKINKLNLCLNFVNKNKMINKIIVGVDSIEQIKSILSFKKIKNISYNSLSSRNLKIIDPRKW